MYSANTLQISVFHTWSILCKNHTFRAILDIYFSSRISHSTAKSARAATNLPSATFLQPFYHMQHCCNITCNTLYSATYLQQVQAIAATRIICNIVCNIVCNTAIVCNTNFPDSVDAGDSNTRRARARRFSSYTRPIYAAILRHFCLLLFAGTCACLPQLFGEIWRFSGKWP
jgi:hypothetical protein